MPKDSNQQINDAVRACHEAQEIHSEFGAWDSEPSWHFRHLMRAAARGQPFKALTISGWELYDAENLGRPGSGNAKNHLNRTAREACRLVRKYRNLASVQERWND